MTRLHHCVRGALALLVLLFAQSALAAAVTVDVTTLAGAAVQDAAIIFDPLDAPPPPGHDKAIIDQVNKTFVPHVIVIRTGTAVTFPNSDRIRHQVYSFSTAKMFTLKLYAGPSTTAVIFDKPGLVVLGCNIHDKMSAFVGVVDTPYFGKTTSAGVVSMDLPAGRYRLRVWHPYAAAIAAQQIEVAAAPLSIPLKIDMDSAAATVAAWPE